MVHLGALDYAAIAAYFLVTALIGVFVARGRTTSDDLFLAGRSLGPLAVGFSLFAANVSSDTLIGLPGAAYRTGISAANYEWMAGVVLIFTALFVLPVLMRARVTTMPELMERRFDARMRKYLSAVTLFLSIVLDTAGSLYAGALIITTFIPGLTLWETCLIVAVFTGIYTAAGGLRAVVYTDVMQAIVLLVGSAVLATIVFGKFDYSWHNVVAAVHPDKLSLIRPLDDPGVPWLGLLTGLPIVGFYYWTMNQYVVQRILGARDLRAAGRASVIAASLKLLPLFLMTIPGAMASVLLPGLDHPDQVFPTMVATFIPAGLTGLIVAGLIAALMSTCSATLNSAATLVTMDFIQPRRPDMSPARLARAGRITTIVITLLAALWAPMIQHFQGLWAYLQQVFAFVASPLVATFLFGLWSKRLGASAALRGLICGHAFSALFFVARELGWIHLHFTIIAGVVFVATALFTWMWMRVLAARDRPADDDRRIAVIARQGLQRVPNDVLWAAAGVLAATAVILGVFW
ncbi:sodium:solute symporter family transporter [Oleiagrimonas soli]|uniref:Na+/glucose cotransporter n=1 Tax=Oleiagrimonas soli TaxID=1543381 RepID=A0A099CSW1_9GAMM|nr:sodium/solute symporter [Oleiagrimonas soli]KGI77023.1 Na+/glucose cotransporter [Oleiagrimonas soli]MBB6185461.1 SSS family solute:Na+ symporter [Oleiagrimonas soli]